MEIRVEAAPTQEPEKSPTSSTPSSDSISPLILARHFDIDHPTSEEEGKLREIYNHAYQLSTTKDPNDVLWQVMHLGRTMGAPRIGESRLDKMYRWAKLKRQESEIQAQLRDI